MSFSPRNRVQIRTDLLDAWSSRFSAVGKQIDTRAGAVPYRLADGLAMILEKVEAWAGYLVQQILPDRAEESFLDRHGAVEGVMRDPAVAAVLSVRVNGAPSTLITFGSATYKTQVTGQAYRPAVSSASTNGSGYVDVNFVAAVAGAGGNQANGTVMTWSATPAGASATGTVQTTVTPGAERETNASYARRIVQRRRERPASGNRADWRDWVEQCEGVSAAFVYPLQHGALGPETLGATAVVGLGPAQGSNAVNTRILSGPKITAIRGFIEGTHDAAGNVVANGEQLRPTTINPGDYIVVAAIPLLQSVAITLTLGGGVAYPWTPSTTFTVSAWNSGTRTATVTTNPTSIVPLGSLVALKDSGVRGGFAYGKVASTTSGTIVFEEWEPGLEPVSVLAPAGLIRPLPNTAYTLRDAVFAYFDALGPGDSVGGSARWPDEATQGRATLYRNALGAAVIGLGGVLDATVNNPASTVTPGFAELLTLNELVFQ